jgi:hypothetical protein
MTVVGLSELARKLRNYPQQVRATLPEMAADIRAAIAANVAAQRGPDGEAWTPTQSGKPALAGAMKSVSVNVEGGDTIAIRVTGIEARHHLGRVRHGKRATKGKAKSTRANKGVGSLARPIIPDDSQDRVIKEALWKGLKKSLRGFK